MPMYTNDPTKKSLWFAQPKEGNFHLVNSDNRDEQVTANVIEGTLNLVRIEFDPGNPKNKIQPYDAFIMHIEDDENVYRIKMPIERNFTYSVARVLGDIDKDQLVRAKAVAGDEATITFCNITKQMEDGSWVRPTSVELPKETVQRVTMVKDIITSHPAYREKADPAASAEKAVL